MYTPRASCTVNGMDKFYNFEFYVKTMIMMMMMMMYTYAHTIWTSRCVNRLTAPTIMFQPGAFHTLAKSERQNINSIQFNSMAYAVRNAHECNRWTKLPHRIWKHWQLLEWNCTRAIHFQVCMVFYWPYIWDPMISQSINRPIKLWVLELAMKSMANYLFWDLRKEKVRYTYKIKVDTTIRSNGNDFLCCRPLRCHDVVHENEYWRHKYSSSNKKLNK